MSGLSRVIGGISILVVSLLDLFITKKKGRFITGLGRFISEHFSGKDQQALNSVYI